MTMPQTHDANGQVDSQENKEASVNRSRFAKRDEQRNAGTGESRGGQYCGTYHAGERLQIQKRADLKGTPKQENGNGTHGAK
jgi:hypothetical protein